MVKTYSFIIIFFCILVIQLKGQTHGKKLNQFQVFLKFVEITVKYHLIQY